MVGQDYVQRMIRSSSTVLGRWEGAIARMWSLTSSHEVLSIVLYRGESRDIHNLLIACIAPTWIAGPWEWENSSISIVADNSEKEEVNFIIHDKAAGLMVTCCSVEVHENVNLRRRQF